MKTTVKMIFVFLALSTINSCNKDVITPSGVYAGIYDFTFQHTEFSPPQELSLTWDAQNLYGEGADSLDINSDGKYDFIIYISLLNRDSTHLLTEIPNPFPYCRVTLKNSLEIAMYTESYPIGLGSVNTAYFVDVLDNNERIDTLPYWEDRSSLMIKMWNENPGGAGIPPFGEWYYANSIKYIGIKMNDKYGWVEIDATDPYNPKLLSCAILK